MLDYIPPLVGATFKVLFNKLFPIPSVAEYPNLVWGKLGFLTFGNWKRPPLSEK